VSESARAAAGPPATRKLRGALIGAGNIALGSHIPQWTRHQRLREEVEIVALADMSPSNLARAREVLPGARQYRLAEELFAREELDFCDICTPPSSHRILVEGAVARGLHVLCEKPLAPGIKEAEGIATAVRRADVVFQPCHQYHFSPQWLAVRRLLPRLGRVYFAEYEVQRTEANAGNLNWTPAWRTEPSLAGGGILADHGPHILYQIASVLGEPHRVQATLRTLRHLEYQVEDTALVTLDYEGGLASVRLSWAARSRRVSFRFLGERGELCGDDHGLRLAAETTEEIRFDDGMSRDSKHADWYAPLFTGFVDRVWAGDRGTEGLDEALSVARVIGRAYESAELGCALSVPKAPPLARPVRSERLVGARGGAVLPLREQLLAQSVAKAAASRSLEAGLEPASSPAPRRGGLLLRVAGLAALAAALAWTFHGMNWTLLGQALAGARPGWLALAACVNLAVLGFQAARWGALVRPLSAEATFRRTLEAMTVGLTVSTVVPARMGELARVEWFGRTTGLSRVSTGASILLDHLVNAVGLLAGLALLPFLVDVPFWLRPGGYFALALFAVGVAVLLASLRRTGVPRGEGGESSRLPTRALSGFLARLHEGLSVARTPRVLLTSVAASLVAWTLEVNVTAFSLKAVGLNLPLTASILVLVAVNLALAIPFAPPANAGTLEAGAILALLEFGVSKEQALAFALCYHLLQLVPIGIIGLTLIGRRGARRLAEAS
jgi:uncharacterized protein (TIRG00374 family)